MVKVTNTSDVVQSAYFRGEQIILRPYETRSFDTDVADAFEEQCGYQNISIEEEIPLGATVTEDLAQEDIWVANVSGNPDAPEKIFAGQRRNKATGLLEDQWVVHPCKEPVTVTREYDPGQEIEAGADGVNDGINLPTKRIVVPPMTRCRLSPVIGKWFLGREGLIRAVTPQFAGVIIKSRPPSNFEPSMDWSLDDMRAYLHLIDPTAELGPTEGSVKANKQNLYRAKETCFKRLFVRLADPRYPLRNKAQFEEFRKGFEKDAASISADEAAAKIEAKIKSRGQASA